MKRSTTAYTGIAACHNDRCPSHKNWLEVGKVYEVEQWNGKTIVGDGAFAIDSSRFKEHFVLFHEGNTKGGEE